MRRTLLAMALILPVALSGCLFAEDEPPPRDQGHDDCWFFCFGGDESMHVHFDFFWPLLFIVLIVAVIAIAAAGGRGDGQEQQQQVIVVRGEEPPRPPLDEKQR